MESLGFSFSDFGVFILYVTMSLWGLSNMDTTRKGHHYDFFFFPFKVLLQLDIAHKLYLVVEKYL